MVLCIMVFHLPALGSKGVPPTVLISAIGYFKMLVKLHWNSKCIVKRHPFHLYLFPAGIMKYIILPQLQNDGFSTELFARYKRDIIHIWLIIRYMVLSLICKCSAWFEGGGALIFVQLFVQMTYDCPYSSSMFHMTNYSAVNYPR